MSKVLITGSSGFIGTHLKKVYPNARLYDLKEGLDILDSFTLKEKLKGIDTIIHLAAYISVEESNQKPIKYLNNNVTGTKVLIETAIQEKVKKIVFASSAAAYEPKSSIYAETKFQGEKLMKLYKKEIETVSLRFFNIYGPGSSYGAVIPQFEKGIKKGKIVIYGDGNQTRDFISVKDIVKAIKAAAEIKLPSGIIMDIGTGKGTSINQLAKLMIKDKKVEIEHKTKRQEVRHSCANTKKMKKYLNLAFDNILYI